MGIEKSIKELARKIFITSSATQLFSRHVRALWSGGLECVEERGHYMRVARVTRAEALRTWVGGCTGRLKEESRGNAER